MKICICGGGSLGHVCAGVMASQKDVQLNILSGHPERWQKIITVTDTKANNMWQTSTVSLPNQKK